MADVPGEGNGRAYLPCDPCSLVNPLAILRDDHEALKARVEIVEGQRIDILEEVSKSIQVNKETSERNAEHIETLGGEVHRMYTLAIEMSGNVNALTEMVRKFIERFGGEVTP